MFNQFKVPTVNFGKYLAEFMIPIALLKEFGSYDNVDWIMLPIMLQFKEDIP